MKKFLILLLVTSINYSNVEKLFSAIQYSNNTYAKSFFKESEKPKKNSYDVIIEDEKQEKIDVNVKDKYGYTPIVVAAMYNNIEMFEYLLQKGANINSIHPIFGRTLLTTAIGNNADDVAVYIIKKYPKLINQGALNDGWLAIEEAVLKENEKILKLLLENGAIIRKKDKNNNDAYDLATRHGKGKIVKILRDFENKN